VYVDALPVNEFTGVIPGYRVIWLGDEEEWLPVLSHQVPLTREIIRFCMTGYIKRVYHGSMKFYLLDEKGEFLFVMYYKDPEYKQVHRLVRDWLDGDWGEMNPKDISKALNI